MLRITYKLLSRRLQSGAVRSTLNPFEALTQIQLGITPPLAVQRAFLLDHCEAQLERRGVTESKLFAMDGRLCTQLMKQLVYEQYLSVPFRVFSFDMEFTGPPVFTAEGPTEDITEVGLYSPLLDQTFSCLVQPACGRKQGPGVEELTHISDEMLAKDGIPFVEAWERFLAFVRTPQPDELPGSEERILLLSHGGKLADVSLIKWTLEKFGLELPPSFVFGDTIHLIRDAHRRRPVTVDKHPPSWKLGDLVQWLHIPPTLPAHRAGNDARMTWDVLYHTLLRYGDDEMTPREQLVPRFFDGEAKRRMRESINHRERELDHLMADDTFLLADAAMSSSSTAAGVASARGDVTGTPHKNDERVASRQGDGSKGTGAASPDLMDLDFDDIFKEQGAMQGNAAAAPITEFKLSSDILDSEEKEVGPREQHDMPKGEPGVKAGERLAQPRQRAKRAQTKRGEKDKGANASAVADASLDEEVFLV
ncbi:Exonuclease [Lotmaria passim]